MPILLQKDDGSYEEPRTRSRARLVVLSEVLTPEEITAELKLAPDRWWIRGEFESHPGEPRRRRSVPNRYNGWELDSRLPESAPPDAHLLDLVDRIGSAASRVAKLVANPSVHSGIVRIGHHTDNWNPEIWLDDSLLQRLIPLGTGVGLDIYVVEDDEVRKRWREAFSRWNDELLHRKFGPPNAGGSEPTSGDPEKKPQH